MVFGKSFSERFETLYMIGIESENKFRVEHLVSCMDEKDFSLIEKLNIKSDALLVNQCFEEGEEIVILNQNQFRMIKTTDRGLSKSRNTAIKYAKGEICLFCDDDEIFQENYIHVIQDAYQTYPCADIIIFMISNQKKKLKRIAHKMNYLELLRVSSLQISFKRKKIQKSKILFDERMGAGTENGAEEEVKFLMDCYKAKLQIWYVPEEIAFVQESESTWFNGFTDMFFENRGMTTRYILGLPLSVLYGIYYLVRKRKLYSSQISIKKAAIALLKGIYFNKLKK